MVDLWICLLVYLFIITAITFILVAVSVEIFDAIMLALIIGSIGIIILLFCYPPDILKNVYSTSYALCLGIIYATVLLTIIYIIYTSINNVRRKHTYINVSSPKRNVKIDLIDPKT